MYYRKKEAEGTIQRKKMVMAKESEKEIEGEGWSDHEGGDDLRLDFGKVLVNREEV